MNRRREDQPLHSGGNGHLRFDLSGRARGSRLAVGRVRLRRAPADRREPPRSARVRRRCTNRCRCSRRSKSPRDNREFAHDQREAALSCRIAASGAACVPSRWTQLPQHVTSGIAHAGGSGLGNTPVSPSSGAAPSHLASGGSRWSRPLERSCRACWSAWRVVSPRTSGASVANVP